MSANSGAGPNSTPNFGRTPQEAEQQVQAWVAGVAAKADRYQDMQQRVAEITETATSPDGMVRVTVASSGIVTGLQLADRSVERGAQRLATEVLDTMRRAQSRLSGRVAEVMAATVGDDPQTVDAVVSTYQQRFPVAPEPDPRRHDGVDELRFGAEDDYDDGPDRRR